MNPNSAVRGRPRDKSVERKVMKTALRLAKKHDIKSVTVELIAETSGVARTTIYRRWRSRSAILADAFLAQVEPSIAFPEHPSALEQLHQQMHRLASLFQGRGGEILRGLLAEALTDREFQVALHDRWIMPRRAAARSIVERAIIDRELPRHTSPDVFLDALYGGLYYWLLLDPSRLTAPYVDSLFHLVSRTPEHPQ